MHEHTQYAVQNIPQIQRTLLYIIYMRSIRIIDNAHSCCYNSDCTSVYLILSVSPLIRWLPHSFVYPSVYIHLYSVCSFICPSFWWSIHLSIYPHVCHSVIMAVCQCVISWWMSCMSPECWVFAEFDAPCLWPRHQTGAWPHHAISRDDVTWQTRRGAASQQRRRLSLAPVQYLAVIGYLPKTIIFSL